MNATPFKIHDENSYAPTSLKKPAGKLGGGLKPSGLGMNGGGVDKTPLKGGMTGQKSARKGLSNLSTSQLNIRSANPSGFKIHTGTEKPMGKQKSTHMPNMKALSAVNPETKPVTASTESEFDVGEMVCSRTNKTEDPYDYVARKAAEMQFALCPDVLESAMGEGPAAVPVSETYNWDENVQKDFIASEMDEYFNDVSASHPTVDEQQFIDF